MIIHCPFGECGTLYWEDIQIKVKDLNASNRPFTARLLNGSLPPGVKLDYDERTPYYVYVMGYPKKAGTYSFTVRVTNNKKGYQDMSFTIKITK